MSICFYFIPPPPWYSGGKAKAGGGYVNACNSDLGYSVPTNGGGYQYAKTGNGYVGIYFINGLNQNNRNYIQAKLNDSLNRGHGYYLEFYANLGNTQKYACNNIGLLLTSAPVYVDTIAHPLGVLPANPQIVNYRNPIITDTLNWVKVSGVYKAKGGEQYITIGNFKTDAQTSYKQVQPTGYNGAGYYIDDVSVIPLDSFNLKADAGKDTSITLGDSVFIGSHINGIDSLKWQLQNTGIAIDSTRPGFWVKPLVSTCYVLTQTVNGFTSSDTVCVNVGLVPLRMLSYELRMMSEPSLRGTKQSVENIWQTANEINVSHFNVQRSVNGRDFVNVGQVKANNKTLNNYTFNDELTRNDKQETWFYRIESVDRDGKKQFSETRTLNLKPQTLNGFSLYPNPARDFVNIECRDGIKQLLVIDYLGQVILRQAQNVNNSKLLTINCKQFSKGLYVLQVITNKNEIKNEKLIVE